MKNLSFSILLFLSLTLQWASNNEKETNPVLTIEGGQVKGVETVTKGIIAYLGVPFAAPPVGNLRWKEPQPVVPWQGVRMADRFGNSCMQRAYSANRGSWNGADDGRTRALIRLSEDCLYLNVWTPAASNDEKLPVMVWIYGGGG